MSFHARKSGTFFTFLAIYNNKERPMSKISFFSRLLDLIAPRTCVACNRRLLPEEDELCVTCLLSFNRTYYWKHPQDNPLINIFREKFDIMKAASWIYYGSEKSKMAVWSLKYYGHDNIGKILGIVMAKEMLSSGFYDDIDVIVPLPLAKNRLRQRGYNQSLMLAIGISKVTNIPIVNKSLARRKFKKSQTKLSHWEREENVENQFSIVDDSPLKGKSILIIDDVITTGATMCSCVSPISEIEGVKISVLSLAFAGGL